MRPRRLTFLLLAPALLVLAKACTTDTAAPAASTSWTPTTLADSVAQAHGYEHWDDVRRLEFTFAVDVDDTTRTSREWVWYPQRDSVVRIVGDDTVGYTRGGTLAADATRADEQFVNDTYWLLMPFYGVWSAAGYTPTVQRGATMPLSRKPATMLTVAYGPDGGYTPGDAYDLYLDADYRLREWTFRKGGQPSPTMVMSWEGYRPAEGLLLPTEHRGEGPVRIHHPRVAVYATE